MTRTRADMARRAHKPGVALPPGIEAAWGVRARRSRGPKPELSIERIVQAGIRVADAQGLEAVSMSRVAAALGAATMALYRYVRTKDELLVLMVDAASGEMPDARRSNESWRAAIARWADAQIAVLRRQPWIVRVPIAGPPITPNQVLWFERGLGCLKNTGLSEGEKLGVLLLVNGFVRNHATLESDLQLAASAPDSLAAQGLAAYGRSLAGLIDAERFPALTTLLAAGVFEISDEPPDADFTFGLERVLDGIETLVRTRSRRSARRTS